MEDITILTVVEKDSGLLDLMIKSVLKFTPGRSPQFLICENGDQSSVLDKYRDKDGFSIIKNNPALSGGSNRHGDGINKLLPHIKTKYAAIVESDCILVSKEWCNLESKRALVSLKGNYQGMPLYYAAFMVFETDAVKNIDFRPGTDNTRTNNKSYKPHEDVAWRFGHHVSADEIMLADCIDCKTGMGQVLGSTFQSEEYMVNGATVAVHFGRGSNLKGKANRKGFARHDVQLAKFKDILEQIILY